MPSWLALRLAASLEAGPVTTIFDDMLLGRGMNGEEQSGEPTVYQTVAAYLDRFCEFPTRMGVEVEVSHRCLVAGMPKVQEDLLPSDWRLSRSGSRAGPGVPDGSGGGPVSLGIPSAEGDLQLVP